MGRVLVLTDDVARIRVKDNQLIAEHRDPNEPDRSAPCEDIDLVMLDTLHGAELDTHVLRTLVACGTALVVSDAKRMPAGLFLPLHGTTGHGAVLAAQVAMSIPRKKRAWQALVAAKIRAQASVMTQGPTSRRMQRLASEVKSGDPGNLEAQAARIYWQAVLPPGERRVPGSRSGINSALDYGYAVVRALLARAVVGTGLHPSMSVFHSSRVNPFALVDDLIEPIRALVDRHVLAVVPTPCDDLTPESKRAIVTLVTETVDYRDRCGPLTEMVERYADGYRRFVEGTDKLLDTPVLRPCG